MNNPPFLYGKDKLSISKAIALSHNELKGMIDAETQSKINDCHVRVKNIAKSGRIVYGINTGFGSLCDTIISEKLTKKLQKNILRSHSVGVGAYVSESIVKLMLVTKIHSLCFGYSGVSLPLIKRILWHLEEEILPLVPAQGSVGASGDLAPLAHLFLPLIGEGKVRQHNKIFDSAELLASYNKKPLNLEAKEGLALINGTQFILSFAILGIDRLSNCLDAADIIGATSLESFLGSVAPFDDDIHRLRPYKGSQLVAYRLNKFLENSEMLQSHIHCNRVQDPYSLRCIPQVHGASRNAWLHLKEMVEIELNSVTDNPIIFSENKTISGGNFHGQPLALPLDYAAMAAAELGNISDRRTYLLLDGQEGLPPLLMNKTGINSGFMIPQYTSAALVSENKSLCHPSSVDSIPTSMGQEDHVSMGSISSRRLNEIITNLENILAVELVCSAQAFDFRKPMKSGILLEVAHELIRQKINFAKEDRIFAEDLKKANELIASKKLVTETHKKAADHNIDLGGLFAEDFTY